MWGVYRLLAQEYTAANLQPTYGNLKALPPTDSSTVCVRARSRGRGSASDCPRVQDDAPYPATVPVSPTNKLTLRALFEAHRDFYANTPFDMSAGLAAGAYGAARSAVLPPPSSAAAVISAVDVRAADRSIGHRAAVPSHIGTALHCAVHCAGAGAALALALRLRLRCTALRCRHTDALRGRQRRGGRAGELGTLD